MKHFQTQYSNKESFLEWLSQIQAHIDNNGLQANALLFHVFSDSHRHALIEPVIGAIESSFPKVPYAGCTTNGGIIDGKSAEAHIVVSASVFEDPDSKVEVIQLPISYEVQDESARRLIEEVNARPWVKAIEMLTTIGNSDMPNLCEQLSSIDESIQLFGGGALATDVHDGNSENTYVVSSMAGATEHSAVFVLLGGEQLHVRSSFLTGWRNLGLPFESFDSARNVLKTLDHKPAKDVYQHYIGAPEDERFFDISVVFPLCFDTNGVPLLRVATNFTEDGSMFLAADIDKHSSVNIAYGDQAQIMKSVNRTVLDYQDFGADAIFLYSCGGRQNYWGDMVDKETLPFQNLAPTLGFYTSGEIYRTDSSVLLHNLTIAVAAIREGEPKAREDKHIELMSEDFSRQIMINRSLTTFINAATEQLVEANNKLQKMAITDGLTRLCTREETERRIRVDMQSYLDDTKSRPASTLMMLDLDHFKAVNDTYGHHEGDEVLRAAAEMFTDVLAEKGFANATIGRWGGEEFMFLLPSTTAEQAKDLAEEIRTRFESRVFPVSGVHTLSAGVTRAEESDTADSLISRVDRALYTAKDNGRNRSVILRAS